MSMSILGRPGAEETAEELLQRIRPRLHYLLRCYRIPAQDAEDVLQESLLALVGKWPTVRNREAWLVNTLKNLCFQYWRRRRYRLRERVDSTLVEMFSDPQMPPQERAEMTHDLEIVLGRLSSRCQSVLKLRYQLGFEPTEVAEELGYRPSSIGAITYRCLSALTRQMVATGYVRDTPKRAKADREKAAMPKRSRSASSSGI